MDAGTQKGLARAAKDGLALMKRIGKAGGSGRKVNGWSMTPPTTGSAGDVYDFVTRGVIQSMLGIISNDSGRSHLHPHGQRSRWEYPQRHQQLHDARSNTDSRRCKEFWSMTLYDLTNNLVKNPINRYAIGSLSGGFKKAKDGSLTFYIQNESPGKDKETNWLPAPKGDFWVVFRTYGPGKGVIEQTWEMPGLVKVK